MENSTPEPSDAFTAAYMAACKDRVPDHNEIGLYYFRAGAALGQAAPLAAVAPSDAQIIDLAADYKSTYQHGGTTFDDFDAVGFARALLGSPATATVTDAMIDAYLKANDAYWKRTDELPKSGVKWRNGTPREATRESLIAALPNVPASPPAAAGAIDAREQEVPEGMALVPLVMTRAMQDVADQEGWQWCDVLAAAEAVTEEQYNAASREEPPAIDAREQGPETLRKAVEDFLFAYREKYKRADGRIHAKALLMDEVKLLNAAFMQAPASREAPLAVDAGEQGNPWKAAIDEALIVNCLDRIGPDDEPEATLSRLISWEVQVALDPSVSQAAADLIERGKALASREEPAAATAGGVSGHVWLKCDNCGKDMRGHDRMGHCTAPAAAGAAQARTPPLRPQGTGLGSLRGTGMSAIARTAADVLLYAAIDCPQSITDAQVTLKCVPNPAGHNATHQLGARLAAALPEALRLFEKPHGRLLRDVYDIVMAEEPSIVSAALVLARANAKEAREAAAHGGALSDGDARRIEALCDAFEHGQRGVTPEFLREFVTQAKREADPEYIEYQRLHAKFGGKA